MPGAEPAAAPDGKDAPRAAPAAPGAEDKIRFGDREYTKAELDGLEARAALERSRELTLPQSANDYRDELPPDFKAPEGMQFTVDGKDPMVAAYRQFAHEQRLDQEAYSRGLGLVAAMRVKEASALAAAKAEQVRLLGDAASSRVDAVIRWMRGTMGPDSTDMIRVFQQVPLASTIRAFEVLMQKYAQSTGRFSQAGRSEPPRDGKIPGYAGMTYAQRRAAQDERNRR